MKYEREEKILNNNRESNNAVMAVIVVTTVVLVCLVGVLIMLMSKKTSVEETEVEVADTVQYTMYVADCEKDTPLYESTSTSSKKLEKMPLGSSCSFIEDAGSGFYKIVYNGTTGYALAQYLAKNKPEVTTAKVTPTTTATAYVKSTTRAVTPTAQPKRDTVQYTMYVTNCDEWISLRASASTSAKRLKEMPLGASCSFIEEAGNGFYKVIYNGTTGYALAQYLTADPYDVVQKPKETTESASASSSVILWVVNCDEWISLRSSPSTSASRLKQIPLGASCEYLGDAGNGFYKVRYNGTVGYALSQYLN